MYLRPFKAYCFNKDVVGNTGDCAAPPYDVIDPELQQQLYEKNKYNIIRLIKGKTEPADTELNNQYTRAADYLNDWIKQDALKQDSKDTIYGYVQNFELASKSYQRISFIAQAKLEEFGKVVRPHEKILNKPIEDRLKLKNACKADFGLVFMLYEDTDNTVESIIEESMKAEPLVEMIDQQDVRHRLFAVTDTEQTGRIVEMMKDKSVVIADGHHRYTTGLAYAEQHKGEPEAQYQMLAFANICHEGLIVLATHRVVSNIENFNAQELVKALASDFEITEFQFSDKKDKKIARHKALIEMKAEGEDEQNAFIVYAGGDSFYLAVLKNKSVMAAAAPDKSEPWRSLDVSVLHKIILEKILGINEEKLASQSNVEYVKDTPNAILDLILKVDSGEKQAAFLMNPPKMKQIDMVAGEGERMPQKSTYFYPKIYSGFTVSKL